MDMPARPTEAHANAAAPAAPPPSPTPARRPRTSRLFRRYFVLILALVTAALLIPSTISYYFSRGETLDALHDVQHEKALAAASRIEQYITNVQSQLRGAALPQLGADGMEQRRLEFLKLLKQVPDVTDIAYLGGDGCEKVRVSRLEMNAVGECLRDRSRDATFREPTSTRPFYDRVYFRKDTEPYMQIAVRSGGEASPVTVADVNLKFMWEVITRIKVGQKGKAFVVDGTGYLIADPDIGLVLRKTDLSQLPHVKAALDGSATGETVVLTRDAAGVEVLTAHARIDPLGWFVFVEQPAAEVFAPLDASIHRIVFLLLGFLVLSALVALFLARGMARPIRTLQEGAELIGGGKLDHAIEIRTGDELESLATQFNRMTASLRESYAGLERKVDERTRELTNALEQQTAITEILRVISSSPTDVKPVLDVVAERAALLCEATYSRVLLIDGNVLNPIAGYQDGALATPLQLDQTTNVPYDRTSLVGRAATDRATLHLDDVVPHLDEFPGARVNMRRFGLRAVLMVPLMRGGDAYGGMILARSTPGYFRDDQVALVETFARQAAIAIDNVRLFNQTKEALEQQTAISEILRVTSTSPTDVQPVLEVVAERAAHLCEAEFAQVMLVDGQWLNTVAGSSRIEPTSGGFEDPANLPRRFPLKPTFITGRTVLEARTIHHADASEVIAELYPDAVDNHRRFGFRAVLAVPLKLEKGVYGVLYVWRREARAFTPDQIALLETFARQAAIAIDNVRLFNETKEALDQQRASGEVLSAISSSIADTKPVFDVILASSQRLFAGHTVGLTMVREDGMLDVTANVGDTYDNLKKMFPAPLDRETASGIAILDRRVVEFADVESGDMPARSREGCLSMGTLSMAFAPMLYEGRAIGTLWVGRPFKGRFSEKQIALLRTFAEQAVIAIQNARLFNETKEALDQQRASGEVLSAISSSIADTKPVFEVILAACQRLFDGHNVGVIVVRPDGLLDIGSYKGEGFAELSSAIFPMPLDRQSGGGTAILERRVIEFPDTDAEGVPDRARRGTRAIGVGSVVFAPMLSEGRALGALWVGRRYKGRFGDKQIALLRTFAEQAAIAIQNARLVNETREALDQQRASGEVLSAISSSIADVGPVFEVILANCQRLFGARNVGITLLHDDGTLHIDARLGPGTEELARLFPQPLSREVGSGMAILEKRMLAFPDIDAADVPPVLRTGSHALGDKSFLVAPMMLGDRAIGALWLGRDFKGRFADKELALLKTFTEQAVIALQNSRLFNETREALEQQKASAEVLSVISSSVADTRPVFDKILESCERLFSGTRLGILRVHDGMLEAAALRGSEWEDWSRMWPRPLGRDTVSGVAILDRRAVDFPDCDAPDYPSFARSTGKLLGYQSLAAAPLIVEGQAIGALWVGRATKGALSPKQLQLLSTFADQAVIAIQNASMVQEIQQKSRELEIASQHKSEFLANMSHELRTPLNAIIGFSEVLIERMFGELNVKQDDYLKDIHASGKHLLSLINDILDLSKVEAGRMELEAATFDVPTAIDNAMTLVRERAQRHGIALGVEVGDGVDEIVADERKFKQILLNLLTNAVKFTPDGGRVDVLARRAGGLLEVAVRDTGIGIAREDQEAVFEEFRQVGRHYTNKQEGTGLGLALTRRFVELHGGTIRVESEPGQGSTFTFTIPIER